MAAQNPASVYTFDDSSLTAAAADHPVDTTHAGDGDEAKSVLPRNPSPGSLQGQHAPDWEGEDGKSSSQSSYEKDGYILVKLEDVIKEIECPLCLGIIRKTRTFMECLHRFCRECIDKAMRIGKKECPTCRTGCPTRRWLRDDPKFDALIAALLPHINFDALIDTLHLDTEHEEKIQPSMADTFTRPSEALGLKRSTPKATSAAFMKRSQGSYQSGKSSYYRRQVRAAARIVSPVLFDYDPEEDVNGNDANKRSSSRELFPDRIRKRRRTVVPRYSPAELEIGFENYDIGMNRQNFRTCPLRAGNKELSWGKGGVRSQTRRGSSNGRFVRTARLTRLIEYLHNLDENEDKIDAHLKLLPLNEQNMPLETPYLCCPPTLSMRHIRQFIATQTSGQVEGIDLFVRKPSTPAYQPPNQVEKISSDVSEGMQILGAEESLAGLLASSTYCQGTNVPYQCQKRQVAAYIPSLIFPTEMVAVDS